MYLQVLREMQGKKRSGWAGISKSRSGEFLIPTQNLSKEICTIQRNLLTLEKAI